MTKEHLSPNYNVICLLGISIFDLTSLVKFKILNDLGCLTNLEFASVSDKLCQLKICVTYLNSQRKNCVIVLMNLILRIKTCQFYFIDNQVVRYPWPWYRVPLRLEVPKHLGVSALRGQFIISQLFRHFTFTQL